MDGAAQLAELFRARIAHHDFDLPVLVTASFGVEQHCQGTDAEAVVKGADEALYRAKRRGRNRVQAGRFAGLEGGERMPEEPPPAIGTGESHD